MSHLFIIGILPDSSYAQYNINYHKGSDDFIIYFPTFFHHLERSGTGLTPNFSKFHEFAKVFPAYVKSSGEKLPNGEEILQVDSYPLTIYSATALQELHKKVQEKEAKIAELEKTAIAQQKQITALETRLGTLEQL